MQSKTRRMTWIVEPDDLPICYHADILMAAFETKLASSSGEIES